MARPFQRNNIPESKTGGITHQSQKSSAEIDGDFRRLSFAWRKVGQASERVFESATSAFVFVLVLVPGYCNRVYSYHGLANLSGLGRFAPSVRNPS